MSMILVFLTAAAMSAAVYVFARAACDVWLARRRIGHWWSAAWAACILSAVSAVRGGFWAAYRIWEALS